MSAAWKIVAHMRPREIEEPSVREFYLVALPQKEAAIAVLRMRHGFDDAELEVIGEAPAESLDWLDIMPGQISACRLCNDPFKSVATLKGLG